VPGATLRVMQINASPQEDLGPWLKAVANKAGNSLALEQEHLSRYTIAPSITVTTDLEGRFKLAGIGRNRLVHAQLEGPSIVTQILNIRTQTGKSIEVIQHAGHREYGERDIVTTYYGASFRHAAAPAKPIVGVVRDKVTKKPLAGATVRSYVRSAGMGMY